MAKARQEEITGNLYNAKALVYIKYDKENYKPGEEFKVRESDVKELKENGYAEVEEIPINAPANDQTDGEGEKAGA
jgi:hypothetical protein